MLGRERGTLAAHQGYAVIQEAHPTVSYHESLRARTNIEPNAENSQRAGVGKDLLFRSEKLSSAVTKKLY